MAGTKIGGIKAAATNKKRYGEDFYHLVGASGGYKSRAGGFGSPKVGKDGLTGSERAKIVGSLGGQARVSKGPHVKPKTKKSWWDELPF